MGPTLVLTGLLVVLAVGRVGLTWGVFSQTTDEAAHVAAGLEWLDAGRYALEPLHPPLARVAVALGPFLDGRRLGDSGVMLVEGNRALGAGAEYSRTLALARAGTLLFFVLASLVVWSWARALFGAGAALAAVLAFTTLPPILAHAGLATTDMALTATLGLALRVLWGWLGRPTLGRTLGLGVAAGLTLLSKFSALLFLPMGSIALAACRRLEWRGASPRPSRRTRAVALALACVVVWGGYRFSVAPATTETTRPHVNLDSLVGHGGVLHDVAYRIVESAWLPAPEFWQGLRDVRYANQRGRLAYLLGETRWSGFWAFFPVALAVKTPLPFLVLVGVGLLGLGVRAVRRREFGALAPAVAATLVLLVCLPSRINLGVRHVLPVYLLLAPVVGYAVVAFWRSGGSLGRVATVGLLAWQVGAGIAVHPDYLAYFNELAGRRPERVLVDSDLDWGQDLLRLERALRERGVKEVTLGYAGTADLSRHDLPPFRWLEASHPVTGWIAISEYWLAVERGRLGWLTSHAPVARVGRSIRLYYLPRTGEAVPPPA